jgi:hypothetical protein
MWTWVALWWLAACDPCAGAGDKPSFLLHLADPDGAPVTPVVASVNGQECTEEAEGDWLCAEVPEAARYVLDITAEGFQYLHGEISPDETGRPECQFEAETDVNVVLTPV